MSTHFPRKPPPTRDGSTDPRHVAEIQKLSPYLSLALLAGATDLGRTTEIDSVICRGRGDIGLPAPE